HSGSLTLVASRAPTTPRSSGWANHKVEFLMRAGAFGVGLLPEASNRIQRKSSEVLIPRSLNLTTRLSDISGEHPLNHPALLRSTACLDPSPCPSCSHSSLLATP